MKIDVEHFGDVAVCKPRGKITIGVGDVALREAIAETVESGSQKIVLEFSAVTTIDSSGIGELFSSYTFASNNGSVLVFSQLTPKIQDILQITQLITVNCSFLTTADAIEYLENPPGLILPRGGSPDFESARSLYLGYSSLGELPGQIKQCRELRAVYAHRSQLRELSADIRRLPKLVSLVVDHNEIKWLPSEIGRLEALKRLSVSDNLLEKLPKPIGQLQNLEKLHLRRNRLVELPSQIADLKALVELELNSNRLKSLPTEIGALSALKVLRASSNQLDGLPPEVGDLKSLEKLEVDGNRLADLPATIGSLSSLRHLGLRRNELAGLHPSIGRLGRLENLFLSHNRLSALPEEVYGMKSLERFFLEHNRLSRLPEGLGALFSLVELRLGNNQLEALPPVLGQLQRLEVLDLRHNELKFLPENIGQLENLRELHLDDNRLETLPASISRLRNLRVLSLDKNSFQRLPPEICKLQKLEKLSANRNELDELPSEIGRLKGLRHLSLASNNLEQVPESMHSLTRLWSLVLHGNRMRMPEEILNQTTETQKILSYLASIDDRRRPLNEAKMLLVGQGGVGKTSLARRLIDDEFDVRQDQTKGIEVSRWRMEEEPEISLNLWDFGGQEIMHATHKFFLTRRSIYLLVLDSRLEDASNRLEYWLKIIQGFSDSSPVLVVGNKIDQKSLDVDRRRLKKKYSNIVDIFETSCATGEGIIELRSAILEELRAMKHLHDELPIGWFLVKRRLSQMSENYMTLKSYRKICRDSGVRDLQHQNTLVSLLHDLGVVLSYRDDPRLEDTHVLNPQWVTRGVYSILNSNLLFQNRGVLEREHLGRILDSESYASDKRLFIVDMMRKFELCFAFEGESDRKFLVPDLLPKSEPYTGDWDDAVSFELHYSVLPASILSRLIVRMHSFVYKKTYWRTGVVLAHDENLALVVGDIEDCKITIKVSGFLPQRQSFLRSIRLELDAIHRSIPGFEVDERVPVHGVPGATVSYKHLLNLQKMGMDQIVPEGADRVYSVRRLLEGVDDSVRLPDREAGADFSGERFDVFLAHNHEEKDFVEEVAGELGQRGLKPWLDSEQIAPGQWFQDSLQEALTRVRSAAIFFGPRGVGKWQAVELRTLLSECVSRDIPVIPVLLPGVGILPPEIPFLAEKRSVRFEHSAHDRRALDELEWGITGRRSRS